MKRYYYDSPVSMPLEEDPNGEWVRWVDADQLHIALQTICDLYLAHVGENVTAEHFIEGARIAKRALDGAGT